MKTKTHRFFQSLDVHTRTHTGPDFSDFLTGQELAEKYSVEAPGWKVRTSRQHHVLNNLHCTHTSM